MGKNEQEHNSFIKILKIILPTMVSASISCRAGPLPDTERNTLTTGFKVCKIKVSKIIKSRFVKTKLGKSRLVKSRFLKSRYLKSRFIKPRL